MGDRARRRFAVRAHEEQKRLAVVGIVVAGVLAIAGIVVTVLLASSGSNSTGTTAAAPPSPIADQWLDVRRRLAKDGWSVRSSRQEHLRDDGRRSTLLILRPKDAECAARHSDQVRIFDVTRGRLEQTFRFEPTGKFDCATALDFRVLAVGRFEDDEDTRNLIAIFASGEEAPGIQIPVVITWDAVAERYNLRGLLRDNAGFVTFTVGGEPPRGGDESWLLDAAKRFLEPYALTPSVKAFGATKLIFRTRGDTWAPLFAGVYRLTAGNAATDRSGLEDVIATPVVYKRVLWSLYTNRDGQLYAGNCTITPRRLLTSEDATTDEFARELADHAGDWAESCEVDPNGP